MADPVQKGNQLVFKPAPTFTSFVVVDGTWRERDTTDMTVTKDGASETHNKTYADPGVDVQCEWVIMSGQTPAKKGDVVTSGGESPARKFTVDDVETMDLGGKPLKQSVTLSYKASLQASLS